MAACGKDDAAAALGERLDRGGEPFADAAGIVDDDDAIRLKLRRAGGAGGLRRQRILIVFAGSERLLQKEALAAPARRRVDDQHLALIFAADGEKGFVVEREGVAGHLD